MIFQSYLKQNYSRFPNHYIKPNSSLFERSNHAQTLLKDRKIQDPGFDFPPFHLFTSSHKFPLPKRTKTIKQKIFTKMVRLAAAAGIIALIASYTSAFTVTPPSTIFATVSDSFFLCKNNLINISCYCYT